MQNTAESALPMLVSWGTRAVYLGPGLQLPAHRNAVAVLALALEAPMRVALDPHDAARGFRLCRSALIGPNQLHLIEMTTQSHAFIYLDGLSQDLVTLRKRCLHQQERWSFDLVDEAEVIGSIARMPRTLEAWENAVARLAESLGFTQQHVDPRIAKVVQALQMSPDDARQAEDWAIDVGLSSSRFQHLFKEHMGIPFRRFRLWVRMRAAIAYALNGHNLTEATMKAGLSSSAHLSAAFKGMFGIAPSQILGASPVYVEG